MKGSQSTRLIEKLYDWIEQSRFLQCIKSGLVRIMPVILIGAFSVVLGSMPIDAYQNFIGNFCGGFLKDLFSFVQNVTMGLLSVYLTFSISTSFSRLFISAKKSNSGPVITSLICFFMFSGMFAEGFNTAALGAQGTFTAIVCALGASYLYYVIEIELRKRFRAKFRIYTDGADESFNRAVSMTAPTTIVVVIFALINLVLVKLFNVTGFQMLFSNIFCQMFANIENPFGSMVLFSFLVNFLWVFGIHGSDVLEPVSQSLFVAAMEVNQELIANGQVATEVYTKTFYDSFALMGGCGNTISLLIAVLLFSKRRSNKKLMKYAALPMIFNVNEILVFGMPVVFNPILAIPYILTPIVLILVSSFFVISGIIPIPSQQVIWTTPALLSGYIATGSISGSILQVLNIFIGVLIYKPFVRFYDEEKNRDAKKRMDKLIDIMIKSESEDTPVDLLALKNTSGDVAKGIVEDMQHRLAKETPMLYYQPQFDKDGNCIGAEALLRWEHPVYGMLFPPLVVKLATEAGMLRQLEEGIFKAVIKDMPRIMELLDEYAHISVNVTGTTIQTEEFEKFLKGLVDEYPQYTNNICIEITEQAALKFNNTLTERLDRIHAMGYSLAIDDFSMGSTSIKYLQTSVFGLVKLDGALSRDVLTNPRSREIISSITGLTNNFGISVLAEYVENEKQRKALEEIDCHLYQGYLYSPAVPVDEFGRCIKRIRGRVARN